MNFKLSADTFVVFSVLALIFSACGGDSGSSANDNLPESVEQFSDIKNIECNVDRECAQIYIEEHDDYVQCTDSKWETVVASKPNKACSNAKSSSSKNKSSSSKGKSSSSKKNQSSSSSLQKGMDKSVYDDSKNTLTDYRNGITYKTVKIGDQIWMAENLNFDPGQGGSGEDKYDWSWCFDNKSKNCDVAGRFYTWAAAIDSVKLANDADNPQNCGLGKTCTLPDTVYGICPPGWHLPSSDEWNALFTAVGGDSTAGKVLRTQSGWTEKRNGTDAFGFSALPAGNSNFVFEGEHASFWSSTEFDSDVAYYIDLYFDYENAYLGEFDKFNGYSVRCVKN